MVTFEEFNVYRENSYDQLLLNNFTLIHIKSNWICLSFIVLQLSLQTSTLKKKYTKQINIGGFKIHTSDFPNISINIHTDKAPKSPTKALSAMFLLTKNSHTSKLNLTQVNSSSTIQQCTKIEIK